MPLDFFRRSRTDANGAETEVITVVSGLPRSGTSMMMRMLDAGGIPVLVDQQRQADQSNPKGYYEFEQVKQMREGDNQWVKAAQGKAVKIISPLLEYLPGDYRYRIVFMQRDLKEILASQREMLLRRGEAASQVSDRAMAELYQKHLDKIAAWLATQPNVSVLYLNYNQVMEDPQTYIHHLVDFFHPRLLAANRMLAVIETSLYRQRADRVGPAA